LLDCVLLLHPAKRFTFSGHIADDRWEVELPVVGSLAGKLDASGLEMKVVVLKFGAQVDASLEAYLLIRNTPVKVRLHERFETCISAFSNRQSR
jgi:hypothetical protein